MKFKKILAGALLTTCALSVSANSAFKEPSDAIEYRQSAFSMLSVQIGDMGAMLKGKVPFDAEQFKMRANNAAALARFLSPYPAPLLRTLPLPLHRRTLHRRSLMHALGAVMGGRDPAARGGEARGQAGGLYDT